jgi:sulfur carrier protein
MVTIEVNNIKYDFNDTASFKDVLDELEIRQYGIAVAINQKIIQKNKWTSTIIKNGDSLLIIKSTQGG